MQDTRKQKGVTKDRSKYRCPPALKLLIDLVNSISPETALPHCAEVYNEVFNEDPDQRLKEILRDAPDGFFSIFNDNLAAYSSFRDLRKTLHEMAQVASLPDDMREDYAKAVVSDQREWERFQERLPAPLWREWTYMDAQTVARPWQWPKITLTLAIGADGRINNPGLQMLIALIGVEAKRLRECRVCQRIFWATRINMVACSKRCANALRQRDFRERKKH